MYGWPCIPGIHTICSNCYCPLITACLPINTTLYRVQSSDRVTLKENGDNQAHWGPILDSKKYSIYGVFVCVLCSNSFISGTNVCSVLKDESERGDVDF